MVMIYPFWIHNYSDGDDDDDFECDGGEFSVYDDMPKWLFNFVTVIFIIAFIILIFLFGCLVWGIIKFWFLM